MSILDKRALDYYVKGLSMNARMDIMGALDSIGNLTIKCLLEKSKGYPKWIRMGLSEDDIADQIRKASRGFKRVNEIMAQNKRPPLFDNPSDTYQSALKYTELFNQVTLEELVEKFGCTWDEYKPKEFREGIAIDD